jgi:malate dehydrogenase (quinone)
MLEVLQKMQPKQFDESKAAIAKLIPSFGKKLNDNPALAKKALRATAKTLGLKA